MYIPTTQLTQGGIPPGYEFAYVENETTVTTTVTTAATAAEIVSAGSVVFDGSTAVIIEFGAILADAPVDGTGDIELYDGASAIGTIAAYSAQGTGADTDLLQVPLYARRRLTPSAAAHTYSVRLWGTVGTKAVYAGAGGAGTGCPIYIRITKAN